jgi:hypothetical protein
MNWKSYGQKWTRCTLRAWNISKLFILQKRIIRIITNTGVRESCREAFKNMEIMTLYFQYIFSLILFAVKNKHLFISNNEIHTYKTRNYLNFHLPTINLAKFDKGPYISGTKVLCSALLFRIFTLNVLVDLINYFGCSSLLRMLHIINF